jgi:SAM-dependent methyltransferase
MEPFDFIKKSKEMHASDIKSFWQGAFDESHEDTRRHYEMLSNSLPFLRSIEPSSVLTIGDNLARDAGYIKKNLSCNVVASNITIDGLSRAKDFGYVDDVVQIDAEDISYKNNEFDVVFVKESFHHFPRPIVGLYEMLRVAKKAVIMIEPNDCVKEGIVTPYVKPDQYSDQYESVGNYKYQLSLREMLKIAWALRYPAVGAKGFNDPYDPQRSFSEWIKIKKDLDLLGEQEKRQYNLFCVCIFKTIENVNLSLLSESDNQIYTLPHDPYNNI